MTTGFDFADVMDEVVDRSGGEQSTAADVIRVRRGLRILLERWEALGFNTWRIRTLRTGVSGTSPRVMLTDEVDDVLNVNAVVSCGTETPLTRIQPVQYAQLADKRAQGDPAQYWLDRQSPPQLHVYPIGPAPLVVTYVQRPAEYSRFSANTDDVPGRWLEAMILGLAHDLARKRPPYDDALIGRLRAEASEAEMIAQRADRDRGRFCYQPQFRWRR